MAATPCASPGSSSYINDRNAGRAESVSPLVPSGKLNQLGAPGGTPRQRQEGWIEIALPRLVGQRRTFGIQHFPARTFEHALRRSCIPLRRGRQPWIAIGQAFGQLAELQ